MILKADPAWLQFGTVTKNEKSSERKNKTELTKPTTSIPLLSWVKLTSLISSSKIIKSETNEFVPHFFTEHSQWYALRIKGDSMTSPLSQSKSFHEGNIIIVDPDKEHQHGDFVVALLPKSKEATFKQYVIDGGVSYLKPLNPQYPMTQIDSRTVICGVVIGSFVSL